MRSHRRRCRRGSRAHALAAERLERRLLLSAGDLDISFSGDGKVMTDFAAVPLQDVFEAAALQPDGALVAVGWATNGYGRYYPDFALARFTADGRLDGSFGIGGQVLTDFGGASYSQEKAYAVAVQDDGRIIAAGRANVDSQVDFALARYLTDGSLDPTFGTGGLVTTDFDSATDEAFALVIQPDGKIVLAGRSGADVALARYEMDGTLDATFGTAGLVTTDLGEADEARGLVLQPDGKIVVAGTTGTDFALARYNADGSLDDAFGTDGIVATDFGTENDGASAVVVQDDGMLVTAGSSADGGYSFAVARYDADGALDASFGTGGTVLTDLGASVDEATGLVLQTDGKIVAGGYSYDGGYDFALIRYETDGSPDASFGTDGVVTTDLGDSMDRAYGLVLQPDGRIVAAGNRDGYAECDSVLVRYEGDGSLDAGFGDDGVALKDFMESVDSAADAMVVQPDGKVIVVATTMGGYVDADLIMVRYDADGVLDTTFGEGGCVISELAFRGGSVEAVCLQPDGKILVGGTVLVGYEAGVDGDFMLQRFNEDGTLDVGFGENGMAHFDFSNDDMLADIAVQPDGRVVAVGTTGFREMRIALARFNSDGSVDTSFGTDGAVTDSVSGMDTGTAISVCADDKIVVLCDPWQSTAEIALLRYNADGSPDGSFGSWGQMQTIVLGGAGEFVPAELYLQPDGKIVLPGCVRRYGYVWDFAVVRMNADGSWDNSFGDYGIVITPFLAEGADSSFATSVVFQADGKIVVAGAAGDAATHIHDFAVVRYEADGTPDITFGDGGRVTTDFMGHNDTARAVGLMPDGTVVAAGAADNGDDTDLAVARYLVAPETSPQGVLTFSTYDHPVDEGVGVVTVTVTRTGGSAGAVTVDYATADGSALAGADYVTTGGTLTFADGVTSRTFDVEILLDDAGEYDECVLLALSNPTGGAVLDNPRNATITILAHPGEAGTLDPDFGGDGIVTLDLDLTSERLNDLVLQPDGKIIAVCEAEYPETKDFLLARFNPDGTLDPTFGGDGIVHTDVAFSLDQARTAAVLPDGRILVAGLAHAWTTPSVSGGVYVTIARYESDGTLDRTFGTDGLALHALPTVHHGGTDIEVLEDGRFLLTWSIMVARFNADGSLDTTFGTDGIAVGEGLQHPSAGGREPGTSMVVQPDGKIVLGTASSGGVNKENFGLVRLNADGSIDTSFGTDGLVSTSFDDDFDQYPYQIALQPDGKIVAAGLAVIDWDQDLCVARYNPDGSLDTTFGDGGMVTTELGSSFIEASAFDLAILDNGKIITFGYVDQHFDDVLFAQFNPDGTPDVTFGYGGVLIMDIPGWMPNGAMVLQPDNRVVVGSRYYTYGETGYDLLLMRLATEPEPGQLQFSADVISVDENSRSARVTVSRIDGAVGDVSVDFTTSDGTAVEGEDYVGASGTLHFADGESSLSFTITILDDAVYEGVESVVLSLSNPTGGAILGPRDTAELQIYDGPGRLAFSSPLFNTVEGNAEAELIILRTDGSDGEVTVDVSSIGGSATAGEDYAAMSGTVVTLADRQTIATVSVSLFDDSLLEGREKIILALSSPGGGATLGELTTTVLNIFDHEPVPAVNAGALDADYATGGVTTVDFGLGNDDSFDMEMLPDGRFVVLREGTNADGEYDFQLARFNADAAPDASFGVGGLVTTDFDGGQDRARRLVVQPDGKIVVVGLTIRDGLSDFALARYNTDGSLDATFGGDGRVVTDFGATDDRGFGIALQPDGKIVACGSTGNLFFRDFAVVRYNADGSLDASFGGVGWVATDFYGRFDEAANVVIQSDGRIVAGGTTHFLSDAGVHRAGNVALACYLSDGSLDAAFDGDGLVSTECNIAQTPSNTWDDERIHNMLLGADGDIYAIGETDGDFLVVRYAPDGAIRED